MSFYGADLRAAAGRSQGRSRGYGETSHATAGTAWSLISRRTRGSEAGARGSHLAAERHSVVLAQNHDTQNGAADGPELRHRWSAPSSLRGTCRHGTLFGQTMGLAAVTAGLILLVFVSIPGGSVVYALLGLVIFAGLVMYDFQRLRVRNEIDSAPLLAASIFLDILNVFQFFLSLFARSRN